MDVDIKINGSGLTYEGKVSLFQATQIIAFISRDETDVNKNITPDLTLDKPEIGAIMEGEVSGQFESPRIAIESLKAQTNPQKIVALAFYLGATSQNNKVINVSEILAQFAKAGEKTPKNITRDLSNSVIEGYVFSESKSTFRLLSKSDTILSDGFPKTKARKKTNSTKKSDNAVKVVVGDAVKGLPIVATLEGYMDYFDVKSRADQIVWILKYAALNGIESLNHKEIIYISNKIGGDINSQNFTNAKIPNVKGGHISISQGAISMTPKGQKHLDESLKPKTKD